MSLVGNVIFAQGDTEKDFQKLFVGLNVDRSPEEIILGSNLKFEKITRTQEITGETITIYHSKYDKNVMIKSKILDAEVWIEQQNFEKELGRHTVSQRIAFPNYEALIVEYNNVFNKFEPYASNIMGESPENEREGKDIQTTLTIKDDVAVRYFNLSYRIPKKEHQAKTQYLLISYRYRRW